MDNTLKKGIVNVLSANIINLIFSIITSFILPKYLPVEVYSMIKTFQLYVTYAGLMHLGYVDGMYLKYGGKTYEEVDKNDLKIDLSTIRIFQLAITVIWVLVGVHTKDYIVIAFALSILPQNMNSYFRYLFQSIGEFKKYSNILNITTIGTFIANIILLFIIRTNNGFAYCIAYVAIYLFIWMFLEWECYKNFDKKIIFNKFSVNHLYENVKAGILLMLGTFSSIILTSIDRWFVKFTLDTIAFAQYSFAVTIDNFVKVAITPVTTTLYNYFCRKENTCNYEKIKNYIAIFSIFIVSMAFPAKFILEVYLTNYIDTIEVLFLLFASQICFIAVKGVYVNLYKVKKMQKKYFLKLLSVILVGCIFNVICFKIYPVKEAYAWGTLLSSVYWFFISIFDFKFIKTKVKDVLYMFIEIIVFLLCGFFLNSILGFIIYILFSIILTLVCYFENISEIYNIVMKFIKLKLKKNI